MLRYHLAALTLKALSSNDVTRRFYREVLGNGLGARRRRRAGLDPWQVEKAQLLLDLVARHGGLRDGMRVLDLGTGWVHFYALMVRLAFDVRVTMVDVWDNRQFDACQHVFAQLAADLDRRFPLPPARREA